MREKVERVLAGIEETLKKQVPEVKRVEAV